MPGFRDGVRFGDVGFQGTFLCVRYLGVAAAVNFRGAARSPAFSATGLFNWGQHDGYVKESQLLAVWICVSLTVRDVRIFSRASRSFE